MKKIDHISIPFFKSKEKSPPPQTRPRQIPQNQEPVWIKPVFGKAWVEPHVEANGDYIGGHYVATIIEEGHWATQEEAQLTGRSYLHPDQSPPILPQPSTTLPPLPKAMENLPAASAVSLSNQLSSSPSLQTNSSRLTAVYNARSEELILSGKASHQEKFVVQTPKGPAVLLFDKEEVQIEFHGKMERHSFTGESSLHVRLHP